MGQIGGGQDGEGAAAKAADVESELSGSRAAGVDQEQGQRRAEQNIFVPMGDIGGGFVAGAVQRACDIEVVTVQRQAQNRNAGTIGNTTAKAGPG